jgi:hypothetical protein
MQHIAPGFRRNSWFGASREVIWARKSSVASGEYRVLSVPSASTMELNAWWTAAVSSHEIYHYGELRLIYHTEIAWETGKDFIIEFIDIDIERSEKRST